MRIKDILFKSMLMSLCCGLLLCVISGCGGDNVPDPPMAYSRLVVELFESLEKEDYQLAAEQIGRLKALDPENSFLSKLQENQYCNVFVAAAQKKLDAGELEEALRIVSQGSELYPFNRNMIATEKLLKNIVELRRRLLLLITARSSNQLQENIAVIETMIKEYPEFAGFNPLLAQKSELAAQLELKEQRRMKFHLLCDEKQLRSRHDGRAEILKTLFDIENKSASPPARLPYSTLPDR